MLRRFLRGAFLTAPLALLACSNSGDDDAVDDALTPGLDAGGEGVPVTPSAPPAPSGDDTAPPSDDDGVDFGPGTSPTVAEPEPMAIPEPTAPVNSDLPSAAQPLVACAGATATGENPMIDDFEDLNDLTLALDGREASWYSYNDESPGGSQLLEWVQTDAPAVSGMGLMHVQGTGFPEFSGVGVGLRWTETGSEFCYYDASYYDGVSFWAKGNSSFRLALQTPAVRPVAEGGRCPADAVCYDSHGLDIPASAEWTRFTVGFAGAKQAGWGTPVGDFDPSELFTIELQFPSGASYEVWIDDLSFYKEGVEPMPEPEAAVEPEPGVDGGVPELPADGGVTPADDAGLEAEPMDAGAPVDAGF